MVCFNVKMEAEQIICHVLTGPGESQGLFLDLSVVAFSGSQGSSHDLHAMGFCSPFSCTCMRTALILWKAASAERIVFLLESYKASTGVDVSMTFIPLNASSCCCPQCHTLSYSSSSLSGPVMSARWERELSSGQIPRVVHWPWEAQTTIHNPTPP